MFIQTEMTPNPATVKFIPDTPVLPAGTGPHDFRMVDFAPATGRRDAPLAARLFNIQGVAAVMIAPTFIAVTKADDAHWGTLKTDVLMAIMDHVTSGEVAVDVVAFRLDPKVHGSREEDSEVIVQIKELLDTRIRPSVANDGGDIEFSHFEDGVVYLHMRGACASCPSSTATLKNGIENMLKHYIPDVTEVRAA